jgi:hypothetical protein
MVCHTCADDRVSARTFFCVRGSPDLLNAERGDPIPVKNNCASHPTNEGELGLMRTAETGGWLGFRPETVALTDWPGSVRVDAWLQAIGRNLADVLVLIDPQVGQSHGQLRSLPLIRALGIERFSYPAGWRGLELVPHKWVRLAEDTPMHALDMSAPLCQIVSQSIEDHSAGDAAHKLLQTWRQTNRATSLVFVFDRGVFARRRGATVRSFADDYELPLPIPYDQVLARYVRTFGPAAEHSFVSSNLAFHGLMNYVRPEVPIRHLYELLNVNAHVADSPLWDLYEHLCEVAGPNADAARIREVVRSWLDEGISRTSDQIVLWLQRFNFDRNNVQRRRASQRRRE